MSLKAVFLDREGVITPKLPIGVHLVDMKNATLEKNAAEGLKKLQKKGLMLFIISNQSCIKKGYISYEGALEIHNKILNDLEKEGIKILDWKICPHDNNDSCNCRKPKPGMIIELSEKYGFKPEESVMIGDMESDIGVSRNAGCADCIYITRDEPQPDVINRQDLSEAADWIIEKYGGSDK